MMSAPFRLHRGRHIPDSPRRGSCQKALVAVPGGGASTLRRSRQDHPPSARERRGLAAPGPRGHASPAASESNVRSAALGVKFAGKPSDCALRPRTTREYPRAVRTNESAAGAFTPSEMAGAITRAVRVMRFHLPQKRSSANGNFQPQRELGPLRSPQLETWARTLVARHCSFCCHCQE